MGLDDREIPMGGIHEEKIHRKTLIVCHDCHTKIHGTDCEWMGNRIQRGCKVRFQGEMPGKPTVTIQQGAGYLAY